MDRGARGQEGEAGRVRGGVLHLQAVTQGQEGQVVRQEPGERQRDKDMRHRNFMRHPRSRPDLGALKGHKCGTCH